MFKTPQLTRQLRGIRNDFFTSLDKNEIPDGRVDINVAFLAEVLKTIKFSVHLATKNGMTPCEISDGLNIPLHIVTTILTQPIIEEMSIGSIVKPKNPEFNPLRSGGSAYGAAIVISMEPFVIVSEQADMRWGTKEASSMEVFGKATDEQLAVAMTRLDG
jgi:hypothetical protein